MRRAGTRSAAEPAGRRRHRRRRRRAGLPAADRILLFFILWLEESGYLPRAAFLLDRLMGSVGLSGHSFIPLMSSFACAIGRAHHRQPARPRGDHPHRALDDVHGAAAGVCAADRRLRAAPHGGGHLELQGLVLLGLYAAGTAGGLAVAWLLKRYTPGGRHVRSLMMELPDHHWPALRNIAIGLWQRVTILVRRVGASSSC